MSQVVIGSRVELSTNVDVDDGLANGASGIMMGVTGSSLSKKSFLWVDFDGKNVGLKQRQSLKHLYGPNIQPQWTPLCEVKRQFPVGKYKCAQVLRTQFPIC